MASDTEAYQILHFVPAALRAALEVVNLNRTEAAARRTAPAVAHPDALALALHLDGGEAKHLLQCDGSQADRSSSSRLNLFPSAWRIVVSRSTKPWHWSL